MLTLPSRGKIFRNELDLHLTKDIVQNINFYFYQTRVFHLFMNNEGNPKMFYFSFKKQF